MTDTNIRCAFHLNELLARVILGKWAARFVGHQVILVQDSCHRNVMSHDTAQIREFGSIKIAVNGESVNSI